ncbi:folylpolyglutamate synthase/dihydrofolate synthase family protein [Salegentibacter sp. F188]|uniref:Dihydrofolate synthase/folylpolyglutamate synthase n=1 Tax=Autumnicola patrickiae TaxID=3075591 RepID=A0ABU3E771_9FLAO|nr:folylpolyglutamate synthase/dihydrofolate synthase family protein [Salegentibacter sp. F188]MDT0691484.1 folylpolyglutamate synthase/dihydrofolate synthase family protein [Salegentibacter sp. F188]
MKTYNETVEWMFRQLPMYQRIGKSAFKKDLTNTLKLSDHLGNPEKKFKSVHVAGTNGKGSSSHMLASVFQEAGYKVGLYTSPHLKDFRERIKINGDLIDQEEVVRFIEENQNFLEENQLSFFEMTVGMAFECFARQQVDIAVVEVGMGGRLDSTNIITPEISLITNIGLDHTAFLGTTKAEIAGEKAGVIKKNIPVVIGEREKETQQVFFSIAEEKQSELFFAEDFKFPKYEIDLKGNYQKKNLRSVLAVIKVLKEKGWKIPDAAVLRGLSHVKLNTGLRGRWDVLQQKPKVILDTAHNEEGLKVVFTQIRKEIFNQLHIVVGVVNDKDLAKVLPLFPDNAVFYFCKPDVPRGLEAEILQEKAKEFSLEGRVYNSVTDAYEAALELALDEDLIFVGGSNFTVAEII